MANYTNWGFNDLQHVWGQRVTDVGSGVVNSRVAEVVTEYNRQMQEALRVLSLPTENRTELVHLLAAGTLQPLTEHGVPVPRQPSASYTAAYPLDRGGDAWGDTRESRELMTVEEVARNLNHVINADQNWMTRKMLASLFDNTNRSFTDQQGTIICLPLANGDAVEYALNDGTQATDDHYLAQANAIGNGADNPFPGIYTELAEHPSNQVDDNNPVIVFVATDLVTSIEALSNFVPRVNLQLIVPSTAQEYLTPQADMLMYMGNRVIGEVDGCVIVEWARLPSTYLIAVASGAGQFLRQREQPAQALKGLFREFATPDGNHQEYRFIRITGFAVRDRVAACIKRIGNASYAIPSGYSTPTVP